MGRNVRSRLENGIQPAADRPAGELEMMTVQLLVIKSHRVESQDPISVCAGEVVVPDLERRTPMAGWIWCTARDGRAGWTPVSWIDKSSTQWRITRDYLARELEVRPGEILTRELEESGWFLVRRGNGVRGWIPVQCAKILQGESESGYSGN